MVDMPPPVHEVIVEDVLPGDEDNIIEEFEALHQNVEEERADEIPGDDGVEEPANNNNNNEEENEVNNANLDENEEEEFLPEDEEDASSVGTLTREAERMDDLRWGHDDDREEVLLFDFPISPIPFVPKSLFWSVMGLWSIRAEVKMQFLYTFPPDMKMETVSELRQHLKTDEKIQKRVSPYFRALANDYIDWKYGPIPPGTPNYMALMEPEPRLTKIVQSFVGEPLEDSYWGQLYIHFYGDPYPTKESLPLVHEPMIEDLWDGVEDYFWERFEEFKQAARTLPENYYFPYANKAPAEAAFN